MKKALLYILPLAMLLSALTACGGSPKQGTTSEPEKSVDAASSTAPDSSETVVSEDEVRRLVLEADPEAKIAAVVSASTEGYEYGDGLFIVTPLFYEPVKINEECKSQLAELNERNKINGEGVLVFLEGEVQPSYYAEKDSLYLTRTHKNKDQSKPLQIVYTIRDEETLEAYEEVIPQAQEDLLAYASGLEELQYVISGKVEEIDEKYHYVLLDGTAERYSTSDYYQGKIRINYDKEGEEWVNQDYIYYVSAYSWKDIRNNNDGDWAGYQIFSSVADATEGYDLEHTYKEIDNGDVILKLLKNTPPLEGIDYEKILGDWLLRFTVPEEWADICDIETAENVVSFYQKASRAEMGGWLFDLAVMEGAGYLEIPHYEIVAEEEGVTLLAVFPTDVQFDGNAMAEYEEMQARIVEILDSVEFERK